MNSPPPYKPRLRPPPFVIPRDPLGVAIPAYRLDQWRDRTRLDDARRSLIELRGITTSARFTSHLQQAITALEEATPWCVCRICQGHGDGCKLCRGSGLLSRWQYENVVPKELKA